MISHLDGALRIYGENEFADRRDQHVRDAGKAGIRLKVFRTDGDVPRESLSVVAQTFFVWNEDVKKYFSSA